MIKKFLLIIFGLALAVNFASAGLLSPSTTADLKSKGEAFQQKAGYEATDNQAIGRMVAYIVKMVLGLLGTIFVVLLIYAGITWMTAAGDEKKVEKAKNIIQTAVIGLIIVVLAYAFTWFIFAQLDNASAPGGGTGSSGI